MQLLDKIHTVFTAALTANTFICCGLAILSCGLTLISAIIAVISVTDLDESWKWPKWCTFIYIFVTENIFEYKKQKTECGEQ